MSKQATFTEMLNGTAEDYAIIGEQTSEYAQQLPDRILEHLSILKGDTGGFAVDRFTHCLQTATRAYKDGRDEEYIVCALLHDIGDVISPSNHSQVSAALLRPYINEKNYWIVLNHGLFQGYYWMHHYDKNRNLREQYKDHPYYQDCIDFCANWDQKSFDPKYKTQPLKHFIPMIEKIFSRDPRSFV